MRRLSAAVAILILGACQDSHVRVLIGATVIVAPGAPPIEDAVIVVERDKIRSVGLRKDIPIPQDTQRSDFTGRWIVPAAGGRIAPGEPATFRVLDHAP